MQVPSEYGVEEVAEDPAETWWSNLGKKITPGNIARGIGSYAMNKVVPMAGMAFHPLMLGVSALTGGMGNLANTMRGGVSQNAYEQARNQRRAQSRIDYMMDRRAAGEDYSKTNLENLLQQTGQKDTWSPPKPLTRTFTPYQNIHAGEGGQGNAATGGSDAGYAAAGGSGMHGGRHYNRGGLAALWPRY